MLKSLLIFLKSFPLNVIFWKLYIKGFNRKIPNLSKWQSYLTDKSGIEIGGPSAVFKTKGYLPLYPIIKALDGVNFSNNTIWEGSLSELRPFKFENKTGFQFIGEGSELSFIENSSYDFVFSCNNLEHIANPIKAIKEWRRIIKHNGYILLILPNKIANFDHKRQYTPIEHLIEDYVNSIDESDLTHLPEILKFHDLKRDAQAGTFEQFENRCKNNFQNRCLHHHVFSEKLLIDLMNYVNMQVKITYTSKTDIFILTQKAEAI